MWTAMNWWRMSHSTSVIAIFLQFNSSICFKNLSPREIINSDFTSQVHCGNELWKHPRKPCACTCNADNLLTAKIWYSQNIYHTQPKKASEKFFTGLSSSKTGNHLSTSCDNNLLKCTITNANHWNYSLLTQFLFQQSQPYSCHHSNCDYDGLNLSTTISPGPHD